MYFYENGVYCNINVELKRKWYYNGNVVKSWAVISLLFAEKYHKKDMIFYGKL